MADAQQRQINEAAEKFADAIKGSYQAVANRAGAAQELNAQLTEYFFNRVISNLRTQANHNREMTQQLADQQQRGAEAAQQLTQESVAAYMNFVNSMFSPWQGGARAAERGAEEPQGGTSTIQSPPEGQASVQPPLEDYDELTINQISERLDDLSTEEIRQLRIYEAEHRNRSTLLRRLEQRIEAGSPSQKR